MNRQVVLVMRVLKAEANARDGDWMRFIYLAQAIYKNTPVTTLALMMVRLLDAAVLSTL